MKLSIDNGAVVCSLKNKNSEFLSVCTGLFDGFLGDKLKMRWEDPEEWFEPDGAIECNAETLKYILLYAKIHGIEVTDEVKDYNNLLQKRLQGIKERERILEEERERAEKWERLCKHGCSGCEHLKYLIDVPKCKKTGEMLREENKPKYVGGVLHLFNLEPFPSTGCPFNINKKQGEINEHLREHCSSTSRR